MDAGRLVPDDLVIGDDRRAHRTRRTQRTASSSTASRATWPRPTRLNAMLEEHGRRLSAVLLIDVPDDEVVRRLSGRRVCVKTGHIYHVEFDPPKREGVCDQDGSRLDQRDDDKPETIRRRLSVYHEETEPLRTTTTSAACCAASTAPAARPRSTTTSGPRSLPTVWRSDFRDPGRTPPRSSTAPRRAWRRHRSGQWLCHCTLPASLPATTVRSSKPRAGVRPESRLIIKKSPEEIDKIAAAGAILVRTLKLIESKIRPGVTTAELDQAAEKLHPLAGRRAGVQGLPRLPGLDLRLAELDGRARDPGPLPAEPRRHPVRRRRRDPRRLGRRRRPHLPRRPGDPHRAQAAARDRGGAVRGRRAVPPRQPPRRRLARRPGPRRGRAACRWCARWSGTGSGATCTRIPRSRTSGYREAG